MIVNSTNNMLSYGDSPTVVLPSLSQSTINHRLSVTHSNDARVRNLPVANDGLCIRCFIFSRSSTRCNKASRNGAGVSSMRSERAAKSPTELILFTSKIRIV